MTQQHQDRLRLSEVSWRLIRSSSHTVGARRYSRSVAKRMARIMTVMMFALAISFSCIQVTAEGAMITSQLQAEHSISSAVQSSQRSAASGASQQQPAAVMSQSAAHNELSASLQHLIDQAVDGSAIDLSSGTYIGPIRITKSLQLRAMPHAEVTIVNNTDQPALTIDADDVVISGIRIQDTANATTSSVLVTGDRVMLIDLHVVTGSHGIKLDGSNDSEVRGSVVEWGGSQQASFTQRGNGIDLYRSHDARIIGNTVRGVFDGIYMEFSDDTLVEHNHIELSRYGIHCMYTNRTIIRHNTGTMNITGGMIMAVHDVEMTDNTFTKQNENVNSQGILLFDAHDTLVSNNLVEGNRVGLYVEYSSDNTLANNAVKNNFIGIQLIESKQNTITGNYFTGNVSDAQANGNSDNDIQANYWDSFSGIDLDGDGRSDTQYAMNPFFQGLIKKKPAFQLFFQTPGIMFLENLYETERASWTTDIAPLMAPPDRWTNQPELETGMMLTGWISIAFMGLSLAFIYGYRRKMI